MSDSTTANQAPAAPAVVVPDYLKAFATGQQANSDSESMAASSTSVPRVSLRGKKFRFIEGGEEIFTQNDEVDVVILGVTPEAGLFVKTFYINGYTGTSDNAPPTCSSDDGRRPSPWIMDPQSQNCATCEKNRFGSAKSRSGKPAKACRDSKRLWVALPNDVSGTVFVLQVPVTSLRELSDYGREFRNFDNVPICSAITTIRMDDDSEFPLLSFKLKGFLTKEEFDITLERNTKKDWMNTVPAGPALAAPAAPSLLPSAAQSTGNTIDVTPSAPAAPGAVNEALAKW